MTKLLQKFDTTFFETQCISFRQGVSGRSSTHAAKVLRAKIDGSVQVCTPIGQKFIFTTGEAALNMFESNLSICAFVLTFASLDLESSCRYIFRGYGSRSYMKVIGSKSKAWERKSVKCDPASPDLSESMTSLQ